MQELHPAPVVLQAYLRFSLEKWGREVWENDPWGRAFAGVPTDSSGDFAWVQHMVKSMAAPHGSMAVVLPQGALFRGGIEGRIEDVADHARAVGLAELEREGWTLNISRYVLPPIGRDIPPLAEAVADFKAALERCRVAEAALRCKIIEGGCHGVYVFYDSRGRALYVGKADKQNLWAEMKNAYNRDREIQQIRTVNHPLARRREYSSSNEKERKITTKSVPLHCLTEYFSAYEIAPHAIDDLEALLIRSFANDLMNVRMETFSHQKAVRSGIGAE